MKRLLIVAAALLAFGIPAWGDTLIDVAVSPGVQNLPVSTAASFTVGFEETQGPATGGSFTGTVSLEYQVLSGPDAGPMTFGGFTYTFTAFDLDMPHSTSFSFTNDGIAGTDVVEAFLVDASDSLTFTSNTVSVNWGVTPEPPSWLLLAVATLGLLVLTHARNSFARPSGV